MYTEHAVTQYYVVVEAVKRQHTNLSDKLLAKRLRKLFANALPSSGWRRTKSGMSPSDLQRHVRKSNSRKPVVSEDESDGTSCDEDK